MFKNKWVKRAGILLGAFLVVFVLAALVLPLVVDVDKYRPQITQIANEEINGSLELGRLKFSLWNGIRVQVEGLSLADAKGRKILAARDAHVGVSLLSLLALAPQATLTLLRPEILIIKDTAGINALNLAKATPPGSGVPTAESSAAPPASTPSGSSALPAIAVRARLGLDIREAKVSYVDRTTDSTHTVEALNVRARDLSLSRPMHLEMQANLDSRTPASEVTGPFVLRLDAKPDFSGGIFQSADVTTVVDLDKLVLRFGTLFHKGSDIPLNLQTQFKVSRDSAMVKNFRAVFHNAELTAQGGVEELDRAGRIALSIEAKPIDLAPWSKIVPMLKDYALTGNAGFSAKAAGTLAAPTYEAQAKIAKMRAKAPHLKAPAEMDAELRVVTDRVEKFDAAFKAPGTDLRLSGSVQSFAKPNAQFRLASTGMDLDQLVDFPEKPASPAAAAAPSPAGKRESGAGPKSDYDKLLDPLRESKILQAAQGAFDVDIRFIQARKARLEPVQGRFTLKQGTAALERFAVGLFDGSATAAGSVALLPKQPKYQFAFSVKGLNLKKAVASQYALFKNTLVGIAAFDIKGQGASFNPETAKKQLAASGGFVVTQAQFSTLDVGKMALDAINGALSKVKGQFPGIGSQGVKTDAVETLYEKISSSFQINGGVFSMSDFTATAVKDRGFDVAGSTQIDLKDYGLKADWQLVDTYDLTGARRLAVEVNGVRVEPLLAEPGKPVRFPISVAGTLFAPAPNYTSVAESLTKVALANSARAAGNKLKDEAIKELGKKAPPALQKVLKGLKF